MTLQAILLALQVFQVAFLWGHDWIQIGRLNDIAAVRRADSLRRLIYVTLVQSVPWTLGLWYSASHFGDPLPHWVREYLWISYGILFAGELRAWWIPYLLRAEPERAARYRAMFGNTHAFLPLRNGLVPNTLHIALHAATLATLIVLALISGS